MNQLIQQMTARTSTGQGDQEQRHGMPSLDLDSIISNIPIDEPHCCVYVAIGSAAHMARQVGESWIIEPQFEQQYPRFLRNLKAELPCNPVHVILIDPYMEDPPFIACNEMKMLSFNWNRIAENIYVEDVCNITVYVIRKYAEYVGGAKRHNEGTIDITGSLRLLNEMSIQHGWFVVVQDYSGNNIVDAWMELVLEDSRLQMHGDHIIYGLNSQCDGGCYLDISQPNCDFYYIIDQTGIKAVILSDSNISWFQGLMRGCDETRGAILRSQLHSYLQEKRELCFSVITCLRYLYNDSTTTLPTRLAQKYNAMLKDVTGCLQLYATLTHILRLELHYYMVGAAGDDAGDGAGAAAAAAVDDIMHKISSTIDPYKWADILSKALKK
jgi:hypothetical protein